MKSKILLAIGDVGGGHLSAAKALAHAFEKRYHERFDVVIEDFYALVDPSPIGDSNEAQRRFAHSRWLKTLVNDPAWHLGNTALGYALLSRYLLARSYLPYRARLQALAPDLVVSLHPYLSTVLSAIKRREGGFRYAVVVTDLGSLLRSWADPEAELIVSPSDEATQALERYGVGYERILGPLYPLSPALEALAPAAETRRALGLEPDKPTVLLTGGGGGTRGLQAPLERLSNDPKLQLVVVCGKDEALYRSLSTRYQGHPRVRVLGFVTDLPSLMHASDVVIAKPGPLTILELEQLGKKVVLTQDLGPQECGNIRYALQSPRVRFVGDAWDRLPALVAELLELTAKPLPQRRREREVTLIAEALAGLLERPRRDAEP
jgi:1,2-diacylglycerol 3-beta-galactosyltransferase